MSNRNEHPGTVHDGPSAFHDESFIYECLMKTKKDDGTFHKKFSVDELQLGFKFYADMLSRLCFFVICFIMILTFFCTFVQSWIRYNM